MPSLEIQPEIQPGETIYVADWHPILYLLTGTRLPTPLVLGEHLVGSQRFLARISPDEELARILAANPAAADWACAG